MALARRITYGQLRRVLLEMGFRETRRDDGVALKHAKSGTIFLFRPYQETDRLQPAEIFLVTQELDARGLLEPESFEALLTVAPA
jgi:hypothetical protein